MCIPSRLLIPVLAVLLLVSASCRKSSPPAGTVYTNGILSPFRLENPVSTEAFHANSLFVDSRENKWITYRDGSGKPGIIRFDGNRGDSYPNPGTVLPLHTNGLVIAQAEDA